MSFEQSLSREAALRSGRSSRIILMAEGLNPFEPLGEGGASMLHGALNRTELLQDRARVSVSKKLNRFLIDSIQSEPENALRNLVEITDDVLTSSTAMQQVEITGARMSTYSLAPSTGDAWEQMAADPAADVTLQAQEIFSEHRQLVMSRQFMMLLYPDLAS